MARKGGYVNYKLVNKAVVNSKQFKQAAQKKITSIYKSAKQGLDAGFNSHPVTAELETGANNPEGTANLSGTLDGYGNLTTFIGFSKGYNPIGVLRLKLLEMQLINTNKTKVLKKGKIAAYFKILTPTLDELYSVSPLPWGGGDSWARQIETGISGLSSYLYQRSKKSRSGYGIQATNKVRRQNFKPKPYLTPLFMSFYKKLNIKSQGIL